MRFNGATALRLALVFVLCLSDSAFHLGIANADVSGMDEGARADAFNLLFGAIHKPQDIAFFLALEKFPLDAISAIRKDLGKKLNGKTASATLSLIKNEIFVDGRKTGITVVSRSVLGVSYRGRTWTYEKNISADQNYFALLKILSGTSTGHLFNNLLPQANAQGIDTDPVDIAATFGLGAGAVAFVAGALCVGGAILTAPVWLAVGVPVVLAAAAGSYIGYKLGSSMDASERALAGEILNPNAKITCSPDKVEVSINSKENSSSIRINRKAKKGEDAVRIFNIDGDEVASHKIPLEQQTKIMELTKDCIDQASADKAMNDLKEASLIATNTNPSPSGTGLVPKTNSSGLIR
jgi:hypothetical protein